MGRDGLLIVDKPAGMTSHDVVSRCRRFLRERRVGHGGTLDPDATGVLLVGVGRVTRLLRFLTALPKTYEGSLSLGRSTDTLDASGRVTGEWDMSGVTPAEVEAAAASLTGNILQVPPMVSAVQIGGRRLHELARQGVEVDRPPRPVTVERFVVRPGAEPGSYVFEVTCSSGTYIRSLVDDMGRQLGGGAHMVRLRRTGVGPFSAAEATALEQVGPELLLSPAQAVSFLPQVELPEDQLEPARHGRVLDLHPVLGGPDPTPAARDWAVLGPDGSLVGVYRQDAAGRLRPEVVIQPAGPGS
jgi:tRNA pseudouridine55 synthase